MFQFFPLFALTVLFCSPLLAEPPDIHLNGEPPHSVCAHSAYVHGYIHGYEEGFRAADWDIHMGRVARRVDELQSFRKVATYRSEFGDRGFFRAGYRSGFRAAYNDAARGGSFRGFTQVQQIADEPFASSLDRKDFDRAFANGYETGHKQALGHSRLPMKTHADDYCLSTHKNPDYCSSFSLGFRLGLSDGRVLQDPSQTQTAQAGR